jgi:hypothetical protein
MSNVPKLLTPRETAELRRCSIRKLEHERANGRGPAYVLDGARVLYRRSDIEAFLRANLRGADAEPRRGRPRRSVPQPATAL